MMLSTSQIAQSADTSLALLALLASPEGRQEAEKKLAEMKAEAQKLLTLKDEAVAAEQVAKKAGDDLIERESALKRGEAKLEIDQKRVSDQESAQKAAKRQLSLDRQDFDDYEAQTRKQLQEGMDSLALGKSHLEKEQKAADDLMSEAKSLKAEYEAKLNELMAILPKGKVA